MKIGVFGGAFNPPHLCHVLGVQLLLSSGLVDKVIIVPCESHPFSKDMLGFEHRLAMARLAFEDFGKKVEVSDLERGREPSYTIDTLEAISKQHRTAQLRLVVGADNVKHLANWKDSERVVKLAPPLILGRAGFENSDVDVPISLPNISSSSIRFRIENGDLAVLNLLPAKVVAYINEHGLYREQAYAGGMPWKGKES